MKRYFYLLILVLFVSGCRVFAPYQMLRQGKYPISEFPDSLKNKEYVIAPNDQLDIKIYAKDGERIINPVGNVGIPTGTGLSYIVEYDGQIKLPILNRTHIAGKTLREGEKMLEELYAPYFNNPFVQLKVINSRVIIFPGGQGGQSMVLTLENTNTTLLEALAKAGGIKDGKAHRIKLIRGDLKNPQIYIIDLSTIDGMTKANLVLQANDIIYVQPRNKVAQRVLENVTPYLTLFSTLLTIYAIFVK